VSFGKGLTKFAKLRPRSKCTLRLTQAGNSHWALQGCCCPVFVGGWRSLERVLVAGVQPVGKN